MVTTRRYRLWDRRKTRLCGTFLFSIPGYLLYGPLLDSAAMSSAPARTPRSSSAALLEIVAAICNIGTAVALCPLARRCTPRAALGYVTLRIVESTIIVAGIVSVLGVSTLRQQFASTGAGTLTIAGQSLVAFP